MIGPDSTMRDCFMFMQEAQARLVILDIQDDQGGPLQAIVIVEGRDETKAVLAAVRAAEAEWLAREQGAVQGRAPSEGGPA